jgi:hypothetical protein
MKEAQHWDQIVATDGGIASTAKRLVADLHRAQFESSANF